MTSPPGAAPAPDAAGRAPEWKTLVRLAAPIALAQAGQMMLGLVDMAIVGHLGGVALAAAAAGHGIAIIVSLFFLGTMMGLDPIVTQRLGARDQDGAWRAFGDALRLSLLATAPAIGLLALTEWACLRPNLGDHALPVWLPMDRAVAEGAIAYAWARAPGIIPMAIFSIYRTWFYANHMTRPMIGATIFANVLNLVLDYVFVYGDEGLVRLGLPAIGLPGYGVIAAGAVTSAVNVLTIAYLAPIALIRRRRALAEPEDAPPESPALAESHGQGIARILRLGLPIGAVVTLEAGVFVLVSLKTGAFGPIAQAGQEIALKIASFTFMVTVGLGAAATVRVGREIGAGSTPTARRAGFWAVGISIAWMAFCAVVLFLFPRELASLFTDSDEVIDAAVPLLRMAALFQVFDGAQASAAGALRGAGDTRLPLLANLFAFWIIGLPVAQILAFDAGMGPVGLWVGLSVGLALVAILLTWRFHRLTRRPVARVG